MVPMFLIGGLMIATHQAHRSPATSPRCGRRPPPAPRRCSSAGPGRSKLLLVRDVRGVLRQRPGAVRRRLRGRRGRDRRPARHERRRQVDAAQGHLRGHRGRPRAPSSSTAATSPTPRPTRSPRMGIAQVPGRPGRLPVADRRARTSSSAPGCTASERRPGPTPGPRCSSCSRCSASRLDDPGRRPLAAASSRCWPSAWPSCPGPAC